MRKIIFSLQLLVFIVPGIAQNKMLSLEDAMVNNRTTLAPEKLRQLQFVFNTDDYVYLKKIEGKDIWVRGNFKSKTDKPFLSLEQLNQKLKSAGKDTASEMPVIQFNISPDWNMTINSSKIGMNPVTGKIRTIIDKSIAEKQNVEAGSGYVAYLDSFNLFVTD